MSGFRHQVSVQDGGYIYEIFPPGKMLPERPAVGPFKTHAQATEAAMRDIQRRQ